jgi:hypothetical protein
MAVFLTKFINSLTRFISKHLDEPPMIGGSLLISGFLTTGTDEKNS